MAPTHRVAALALVLVALSWTGSAQAVQLFIGPPTGGHCEGLGGFWITSSSSCLLFFATIHENDQLFIYSGSTLQIAFSMENHGIIQNDGKIVGQGTIWNHGLVVSDEIFVNGYLINKQGEHFQVEAGGECNGNPGSNIVNYGTFLNRGIMDLRVDGEAEDSVLFNVGTLTNTGTIFGGSTVTHPGALLYNQGKVDNVAGVIRNTTVENESLIIGGLIDDIDGASAFVTNHEGGTIDGAHITKVSIDNSGTLDNHTLGSGTITNRENALIRAVGGEAYLVYNDGVVDILDDFELFNNFYNNASGVLVNRGAMLSHTRLVNHGLVDSRGPWVNEGDEPREGVIDNFGTFLNLSSVDNCIQSGDEQLNNFGTFSNGGFVTSCGSTNQGLWYECGQGGFPAGLPVIPSADADGDAVCAAVDCEDHDALSWVVATEVEELGIDAGDHVFNFNWSVPHYFGGSMALYDLIGSPAAGDLLGQASCAAAGVAGTTLEDPTPNLPDSVLYFLVRAAGCGGGNTGVDSEGVPRQTPGCS